MGNSPAAGATAACPKDDGGPQISFSLIPDVCWELVSSFAAPPDVYNLALSSKHFFDHSNTTTAVTSGDVTIQNNGLKDLAVGSKVMICNIQSMPELNGRSGVIMDAATAKEQVANDRIPVLIAGMREPIALKPSCVTSPLLATTLLRQSLLSSLGRVLDHSTAAISLKSVVAMPEGALIAGSTVAQACLGVLWESKSKWDKEFDVDIFCSAKAAPLVRSVSIVILICNSSACQCNYLQFQL